MAQFAAETEGLEESTLKQGIFIGLLLLAVAFGEGLFRSTDVAKLEPVELVVLRAIPQGFAIQTDTGSFGSGTSIADAIQNLEETATGKVFLETADYVLLEGVDADAIPVLLEVFRPSSKVLFLQGDAAPESLAAFLRSRPQMVSILRWKLTEANPPTIRFQEGVLQIAQ